MMRLRRLISWILLAIYWPSLIVATHLPHFPKVKMAASDKFIHFLAFFILTVLYWLARYGRARPGRKTFLLTMGFFGLYAGLDEITQKLVHRSCELEDWLADMGGVCLGFIFIIFARYRTFSLTMAASVLFLAMHTPLLEKIPLFWQRFEQVYVFMGYLVLTMVWWWFSSAPETIVFKKKTAIAAWIIIPLFALVEESLNLLVNRNFDSVDLAVAIFSLFIGTICALIIDSGHRCESKARYSE